MGAQEMFEIILEANGFLDFHSLESEFDVVHCSQVVRVDHSDYDFISDLPNGQNFALFNYLSRQQV